MQSLSINIQMKATEQHFPAVLFIALLNVILTFECGGEIFLNVTIQLKDIEQYFSMVHLNSP